MHVDYNINGVGAIKVLVLKPTISTTTWSLNGELATLDDILMLLDPTIALHYILRFVYIT